MTTQQQSPYHVSPVFLTRILGAFAMFYAGIWLGLRLYQWVPEPPFPASYYMVIGGLLGFLIGLIITPHLLVYPLRRLRDWILELPTATLLSATLGFLIGVVVAALLSVPIYALPLPYLRGWLALFIVVLSIYVCTSLAVLRQHDIVHLLRLKLEFQPDKDKNNTPKTPHMYLVDTSALIDGRIVPLARLGFLRGDVIVPQFVLRELQAIADSPDPHKRRRGRRGLERLSELQSVPGLRVYISDIDAPEATSVDHKLIRLSRQHKIPILTTDYNLGQLAQLENVDVLNIHRLASALQLPVHLGEHITIDLVEPGKGENQGVGYLEDGTLVVVEEARALIGQRVPVVVTKILPTQGGRIVFARLAEPDMLSQ